MTPGSIVRCRNRDWVLLPDRPERPDLMYLRPLTGATEDVVAVHRRLTNLVGGVLPSERVAPSVFQPPTAADVSDATSAHLLWQAARLALREGATPFRSLGRISIRPRVYQFVPLLMALRLDPVRLFIAETSAWARRSRRCSSHVNCSIAARSGACAFSARPTSVTSGSRNWRRR
jgi:hypothetical protein